MRSDSSTASSSRGNSYDSDQSNVASSSTSASIVSSTTSRIRPDLSICLSPQSHEQAVYVQQEYAISPSLLKHPDHSSFPFGFTGLVSRRPSGSLPKRRLTSLATLCLALSIPILGLLTAREWIRRDQRIKLWEEDWSRYEMETRWGMVPRAELGKEEEERQWYGNRDNVGPSPFDHVPEKLAPGQEKRRILFLTDYKDYLERMNSHTYEIIDAALRHPHVTTDVWGPGWDGYDRSLPLSLNVRRRAHRISQLEASKRAHQEGVAAEAYERDLAQGQWTWPWNEVQQVEDSMVTEEWEQPIWNVEEMDAEGCSDVKWDVVFTISNIFREDDPNVDALDCGALLIQQLGDCHSRVCTHEWYPFASNLTVSKYGHETIELFSHEKVIERYPGFQMQLFGHSPDSANEWHFWPVKWEDKKQDARVFGYDGSFYPLRTKITDHIRDHPDEAIIERHPHPGYTLSPPGDALDHPLETYELHHPYYAQHERLREDFANGMRTSRVCVFDASLERKMIRKYAQAFLSGCVVAGDVPTEHEEALNKFMIVLLPSWDIERINQEIQWHLDHPDVLRQKALEAFAYARRYLTNTNKVSGLLSLSEKYRAGHRGYDFFPSVAEHTGRIKILTDHRGATPPEGWKIDSE